MDCEEGLCSCGANVSMTDWDFDDTIIIVYWKCDNCGKKYKEIYSHCSVEEI